MPSSLQPYGLQYNRLHSPSQSSGVGSNSNSSLELVMQTISFSDISFFICLKSSFFFFNLNLFILIGGYFTILYWFCHTSTWILHGCTCVPHPEPPSHLPPRTIPPGHPSAPAPRILYQTWSGDSFLIWYYSCIHAIPPNHPTLSLSHRVQKTVLYNCVSFAGSSLPEVRPIPPGWHSFNPLWSSQSSLIHDFMSYLTLEGSFLQEMRDSLAYIW